MTTMTVKRSQPPAELQRVGIRQASSNLQDGRVVLRSGLLSRLFANDLRQWLQSRANP